MPIYMKGRKPMEKSVLETALSIGKPVIFTDHNGKIQSLRKFCVALRHSLKEGVTDIKATREIVPARFSLVEISSYYEVIIAGDSEKGWKVFSLSGEPLFNNSIFFTRQKINDKLDELTKDWFRPV